MKTLDKFLNKLLKNPPLILAFSFITLILVGAILLNLPFSSADGKSIGFVNALFTASSASCVTGLIVVNTAEGWSAFGKFVIICLIQIGGLGTMTIIALISVISGKKIGLRERMVIKEQLNSDSLSGMVRLIGFVIKSALSIELIGAILLSTSLIPRYGLFKGVIFSLFHAVSAFCNAGFDLFGDSLMSMQGDWTVNLTIAFLVIIGGLGFAVYADVKNFPHKRKFSTHSKLVFITTLTLLFSGTLLLYFMESQNPATMAQLPESQKWLASFFQSTIMRTAGFNSIDLAGMRESSVFVSIILMFIGGSPGSTAGGLKTTTFAIMVMATITILKGKNDTEILERRVNDQIIKKVLPLFFIAIGLVTFVVLCLTIFEGDKFDFLDLVFETVSAFATVGVTRGITPEFSDPSKLILSMTMFLGRVGPTSFAIGLFQGGHKKKIRYAEGKFIVG